MQTTDSLDKLKKESSDRISKASSIQEVENIRINVLGRKGALTEILRNLSKLSVEEKREVGKNANLLKEELESLLHAKTKELEQKVISEKIAKEKFDIYLPPFPLDTGHFHPVTQTIEEITGIFKSIGFNVENGPEIETEWYNFEALNIPSDHPARDTQDTFFLKGEKRLLRTHTSPVQIRVMEKQKPPVRIIVPGRVYRNEATDASHSAVFHQIEGLAVDEKITFADLKGTYTQVFRVKRRHEVQALALPVYRTLRGP
jgi:phenylalanyl-tRNA synthetase alpha chain